MIHFKSESSAMTQIVEFYKPSPGDGYDGIGVHPRYDKPILKCYGALIPQTGQALKGHGGTFLEMTSHKLVIRYPGRKKITADMIIKIDGDEYIINYILDPYNKHETLEIFCYHKLLGDGY